VVRLFRSPHDSQNWFAFSFKTGWVRFPARVGGWADRRPSSAPDPSFEVPIERAFHTGMLESVNDWCPNAA
jgi:hypothetical protein